MNEFFAKEVGGGILVERHVASDGFYRQPAMSSSNSTVGFVGGSSATVTLHSENWPETARKSCLNRLGGNGCWARHCTCEDCQPRIRRDSGDSFGGDACWEPTTMVTDEQLHVSYEVMGLLENELPIKGTYVDARIIPGFKYLVRYLDGPNRRQKLPHHQRLVFPEPVRLQGIGAGYGKRLIFDTKSLKGKVAGHFWSDSWPDGYALSLAALDVGQRFSLRTRSDQELGRVTVKWVAPEPAECSFKMGSDSVIVRVTVAFKANVSLTACRCLLGCHDYEDVPLTGLAWLERPAGSRSIAQVTRIEGIQLPDMPDLKLTPEV